MRGMCCIKARKSSGGRNSRAKLSVSGSFFFFFFFLFITKETPRGFVCCSNARRGTAPFIVSRQFRRALFPVFRDRKLNMTVYDYVIIGFVPDHLNSNCRSSRQGTWHDTIPLPPSLSLSPSISISCSCSLLHVECR